MRRGQRDGRERQRGQDDDPGIGWAQTEQDAARGAAERGSGNRPDRQTDGEQPERSSHHQPQDIRAARAKGDANRDLAGPARQATDCTSGTARMRSSSASLRD